MALIQLKMTNQLNTAENTGTRISIFFPVYRDEHTIRRVTEKALHVLSVVAEEGEVIIIDDCSPDRAGQIADELAEQYEQVRVVHHKTNLGYGKAIQSGFRESRFEWICQTDGDDEYDLLDLPRLMRLREFYDLIITFRYVKLYSTFRILVSRVYNVLVRILFRTTYRDISTGFRLVRKAVVDELALQSTSPFIGAELAIKVMLKGYRVGEVGIQTFPRSFGSGGTVRPRNIFLTIRDMLRVYRTIFSKEYDLPEGRKR